MGFHGILDLQEEFKDLIAKVENPSPALEAGAKAFTNDLLKLAKPRSEIRSSRHTHLVDSFAYKKNDDGSYTVGWGTYYGRMVERGTRFMGAQPHFEPMWRRDRDKYFDKMIKELNLN